MKKQHRKVSLSMFSTLSGVLIVIQSRINGELSDQMGDSLEAALVSFGTGLIFVSLISLFRKDVRSGFVDIFNAVTSKQLQIWRLSA